MRLMGPRFAKLRWYLALLPVLALLVPIFLVPLSDLLGISLRPFGPGARDLTTPPSVVNYATILGDGFYWSLLGNSLRLAFFATLASLLIAYPVAYYLTRASGWERTLIAVACLLPLFVNIIVGILGWYILLLPFGIIQQTLSALGLVDGPIQWLRSFWALVAVLTYEHLPFAILVLAASLQNVPRDKIDAARILGASTGRIVWTIMLPLTMPGIVASAILVFSLSVSSYLVPILIAGPRAQVIPISIFSYASDLLNWNMAGALAFVLLVVVAVVTYAFIVLTNRLTRRGEWEMV